MAAETSTPTVAKIRRRSSIRFQLVIGFAVIVGLTILSVLVTTNALRTLEGQTNEVIETTVRIKELSQNVESQFLLARQAEAAFLQRWRELGFTRANEEFVTDTQNHIREARQQLRALETLVATDSENVATHLREDVAELKPKLDEYESTFGATVDSIEVRSQADGFEDRLNRGIDTLEIAAIDFDAPDYQNLVFQLQNNQLSYGNSGEQQYIDNTRLLIDDLLVLIEETAPDVFQTIPQAALVRQLEDYQDAFNSVVELDQTIAINAAIFQEITDEINTLNVRINEEATESRETAVAALQQNVNRVLTLSTVIGGLTVLISVTTAIVLTQRIVNPLSLLTETAQQISRGELDVSADIKRRDEFGVLGQAFNLMVNQLRTLIVGLEKRVTDRTRDLALAAEVGQSLAAMRDLDALLTQATENIRDRFNLYYTQIYLVDASARNLVLRAGTGTAGEQLMRRGHRLLIEPKSINGSAAARREPIIVADTETSPVFRPNALLPLTRSEMSIPLIAVGRVVGVLDLQSETPNTFTEENLPAFMSLAGQLAVAIDNAQLFEETRRAQMALQTQAQQLTHGAWQTYLDAIRRGEWLGYSFDAQTLTEIDEPVEAQDSATAVAVPIIVSGEQIGLIQLEQHNNQQLTEDQRDLIATISQQVSQQIENLRLLAETDRYRSEAEQATRRLIREAWDSYLEKEENLAPTYVYDRKHVVPGAQEGGEEEMAMRHSLIISGETIGYLELDEADADQDDVQQVLAAVSKQLSAHIENLRLSEETARALAETQKRSEELAIVNRVVSTVSSSLDLTQNMNDIAMEISRALNVDEVGITLLDVDANTLRLIAVHNLSEDRSDVIGLSIPLEGNLASQQAIDTQQPVVINDVLNDPLGAPIKDQMEIGNFSTLAILPMVVGQEVIGTVGMSLKDPNRLFVEDEINLAQTIVLQAATAVQNARLFSQTEAALAEVQRRSDEMSAVNEIAQIASQQFNSDQLFKAVYEQISGVMAVDTFHIAMYDEETNLIHYPVLYEMGKRVSLNPHDQDHDSFASHVIQSGEPLLKNFTSEEISADKKENPSTLIGESEDLITASLMFAPLRIGNQVKGVVSVQSYQVNAYNEENLSLLSGIANYTSVALENTRLFEETQGRARRERILREVTTRVNAAVDAESMLRTAAQEVSRALGIEATVYLDESLGASTDTDDEELASNGSNGRRYQTGPLRPL